MPSSLFLIRPLSKRSFSICSYPPALCDDYTLETKPYDPSTGQFHWLHTIVGNAKAFILGTFPMNSSLKREYRFLGASAMAPSKSMAQNIGILSSFSGPYSLSAIIIVSSIFSSGPLSIIRSYSHSIYRSRKARAESKKALRKNTFFALLAAYSRLNPIHYQQNSALKSVESDKKQVAVLTTRNM